MLKVNSPSILTLPAPVGKGILGSTSRLARRCHHQRVEVGLSPSVDSGVSRRIYLNFFGKLIDLVYSPKHQENSSAIATKLSHEGMLNVRINSKG